MFTRTAKTAIIHVDGDAFFAACEQAMNPELRGKPVITGQERGIVSAASYEAKAHGVKRGVPLWEVRKLCPQAIIMPSDYESYSLFSKRMFDIIRRYTSSVEEYGIDEAFADLTGLRRPLNMSYPKIAHTIKCAIEQELNISVSVGLSTSKVLAKLGSKWNKPSGFTVIARHDRERFLRLKVPGDIWGIGPQTAKHMDKLGLSTVWDFVQRDEAWVGQEFTKPIMEIWQELHGRSVLPVNAKAKRDYKSIQKTRTFTPASRDPHYVFAQLSKNVENACIKLRRHGLLARRFSIFLKTQEFRYHGIGATLNRASAFPTDILPIIKQLFSKVFQPGTEYRSTGITVFDLQSADAIQMNLFEGPVKIEKLERLYECVDDLSARFGKHTVRLGSSMAVHTEPDKRQRQRIITMERHQKLRVGNTRKYVNIPFLGSAS